jgi:nuclear pore complex protein Nup93
VEIHKRVGAFGMALETINKCLSDVICAMSRGRLDSDSQATSLVHSSDDVLEASRNYPQARSGVYLLLC